MSTESEILSQIEALKGEFADTRTLYREVCVLLFFRHGITPTSNKLYQYVRRGSMNVPTEELAKFWDNLRKKARVDIEHPDLPTDVKAVAAEAIAALWQLATQAARGELAAARLEYQAEAEQARASRDAAEQAVTGLQASVNELRARVASGLDAVAEQQQFLEAERRAHAGAQARVEELLNQLEQGRAEHRRQQEAFSADLAKARKDVEASLERAAASERRALMEIDQERQARAGAQKAADGWREKLSQAEGRVSREALDHKEAVIRLTMELNVKSAALQQAQDALEAVDAHADNVEQQLTAALQAAASHEAEARTLQSLVNRLTPAPSAAVRASRKKASTGPI